MFRPRLAGVMGGGMALLTVAGSVLAQEGSAAAPGGGAADGPAGASASADPNPAPAVALPLEGASGAASVSPAVPVPEGPTAGAGAAPSYGESRPGLLLETAPLVSPKAYTLSVTGGSAWFDGGVISTMFEPWTPNLRLQLGRQWFNQIQLQADLGMINDTGYNLGTDSGEISSDTTDLSAWSVSLGLAYRFDYVDEQLLVPYLSAGLTGVVVSLADGTTEESDDASTEDETATTTAAATSTTSSDSALGNRLGYSLGGGLELLLDKFGPARAADLELNTGINDSYLVLDLRYYTLRHYLEDWSLLQDEREDSVDLSGYQLTAGLKFDF